MQTFREKRLLFDFPDDWQVVQYDAKADPAAGTPAGFYRRIITSGGVAHVQAVDFVCRQPVALTSLQLIEVKDDRLSTQSEGIRRDELFKAVMNKVASTLTGLLIAERLGPEMDDERLLPIACLGQRPAIEVILFWIEPPAAATILRRVVKQDGKALLQQKLTAKLQQWKIEFALYNLTDADRIPPHWQAREI